MPGESQTAESERPALSIVEGIGTDAAVPELGAEQTTSTKKPREARSQAVPSASSQSVPGNTTVFADDGTVISVARAASLRKALDEFRTILIPLVQESSQGSADIFRTSVLFSFLRGMTSRSIFGRQLSHEELVGQYASLYQILERPSNLPYAETALFGLLALQAKRNAIAQTVLEEVRFCALTSVALVYVMRGVMRFAYAAILIAFFSLYAFFGVFVYVAQESWSNTNIVEMEVTRVVVAALFGCLGAVVSLLMRLAEFDKTRGKSKEFLILSGGTQPLVGGIFAAVVASIIVSEVVTVAGITHSSKLWLFVVVGFLSGFSERFTRSMLSVAEDRFSVDASKPDRKPPG